MPENTQNNIYEFSYAELAKTFLIILSQTIERGMSKGLDQEISIKDHITQIYEVFTNEIQRAAHLSKGNNLKNATERLEESLAHFKKEELDKAKLAEGVEYVSNRYVTYFGIPGFRYAVTPYFEAQEALKMIGLA